MVDAVITWVDGNDPAHQEKRNYYLNQGNPGNIVRDGGDETRWIESGEIWYTIHLLRKNADWIDRIFLVTDNQRPAWLTEAKAKELNVVIIDHQVIFADMPEVLPVFNSTSIESVICRIPGLSEQFLLLNDDMFIIKPIKYKDYFGPGLVIPRGKMHFRGNKVKKKLRNMGFLHKQTPGLCGYNGGKDGVFSKIRLFNRGHAPYPLVKNILSNLWSEEFIKKNSKCKFRDENQINIIDAFYNKLLRKGRAIIGDNDWVCYYPGEQYESALKNSLSNIHLNSKAKTLCFQSVDKLNSNDRLTLFSFLESIL